MLQTKGGIRKAGLPMQIASLHDCGALNSNSPGPFAIDAEDSVTFATWFSTPEHKSIIILIKCN